MADPLTITTAVTTFLKTAIQIGLQIKSYKDGLDSVGIKIETICHQIDCVGSILRSLQATFDASLQDYIQTATGHIGSHCRDLERSLQDGDRTLQKLLRLVVDIHGRKSERGIMRKDYKLRELSDQLDALRERLSNNLGVLQISFAAIQSWRQEMWFQSVNIQTTRIDEDTTLLRGALAKYQKEGRDLLVQLNEKLDKLPARAPEVVELKNLKACLHSGWKVVAEVSTVTPDVADDLLPSDDDEDLDALFGEVDDGGIRDWIHSIQPGDRDAPQDEFVDDDDTTVVPSENDGQALEPFNVEVARRNAQALFDHSKENKTSIRWDDFRPEYEAQLIEIEALLARVRNTTSADNTKTPRDDELTIEVLNDLFGLYEAYQMWKKAATTTQKKVNFLLNSSTWPTSTSVKENDLETLWAAHFRSGNWKQAGLALEKLRQRRALARQKRREAEERSIRIRSIDDVHLNMASDVSFDVKQAACQILQGNVSGAKAVLQEAFKEHEQQLEMERLYAGLLPVHLVGLQYYAMCAHISSEANDQIQHRADRARYRQVVKKRGLFSNEVEVVDQDWNPALSISRLSASLIPRLNILVLGKARDHARNRAEGASTITEILFGQTPAEFPEHHRIIVGESLVHLTDYYSRKEEREIINVAVYYSRRGADPLARKALKDVHFDFGIILTFDDECGWDPNIEEKDRRTWEVGMEKLKSEMPLICINVVKEDKATKVPLTWLPQMVTRRPHPAKTRYLAMELGALQLYTGTKDDLSENRDILMMIVNIVYGHVPKKQSGLLSRGAALWIDLLDWLIWMTPFSMSTLAGARFGDRHFVRSLFIFLAVRISLWVFLELPRGRLAALVRVGGVLLWACVAFMVVLSAAEPPQR